MTIPFVGESRHDMGVSENSVPLNPMVLLIIIPIKWLLSLGILTRHCQTNPYPNPCYWLNRHQTLHSYG